MKDIENLRLQVDRVRALKNEQLSYGISRALMNVNNKIVYNKSIDREALMRVKIARIKNAEMEFLFPKDRFSISNLTPAEYIYEFYESGKYISEVFSMTKHKFTITLNDKGEVTL